MALYQLNLRLNITSETLRVDPFTLTCSTVKL
jgi:hypothetical protein